LSDKQNDPGGKERSVNVHDWRRQWFRLEVWRQEIGFCESDENYERED